MAAELLEIGANCSAGHNDYLVKRYSVRITVGITCVLSMFGATLVMASFLCFKTSRSTTRFVLFNIALMDFLVAFSNFFGDVGSFDSYFINSTLVNSVCSKDDPAGVLVQNPPSYIKTLCIAQAFTGLYSTLGSVLWTSGLAVYLFFFISQAGTKHGLLSIFFSFILSYFMPLGISLWALLTDKLGYSPYNAASWCTLIIYNPKTKVVDKYLAFFGYNLWIYLTMFLTIVIYLGLRLYLADQVSNMCSPYL